MIPEDDTDTKEETSAASTNDINNTRARIISKAVSTSSTSWSRLKDPRIVRVSRAFGGKDRHSKVCTVRGLRDRRVRLSVPTAIQLYDLQDRLGLNQPSKVVDWLLNEAKEAIDELPPLQIPQGSLISHPMFMNNSQAVHHHEFLSPQSASHWGRSSSIREEERSHELDPSNFLSRQSLPFPSLFNATLPAAAYNPNLVRWDPSNIMTPPPSQRSHESLQNNEDFHHHHNFSLVQLSSSHNIPAGSQYPSVLVYHHHHQQPAAAGAPSHHATNTESKQADFHAGLQLSANSSPVDDSPPADMRPFQFHTKAANLLPEQSNSNQFH